MDGNTQAAESRQQRAAMLDRIYRRISRLDNETLVQLDQLTDTAESIEFYAEPEEPAGGDERRQRINRRAFVITLMLGGVAAATGGAALLLSQKESGTRQTPTLPASAAELSTPTLQGGPVAYPSPTPATGQPPQTLIDDLRDQLTQVRSERIALRAELDAARDETTRLRDELQRAQTDMAYAQQVIDLYKQLEAVGLDAAILAGMSPVGLALLSIGNRRSLLEVGIQQAAALLAAIAVQSPTIANGLMWLEEQVNLLAQTLQNLEDALGDFFDPLEPVANQIGEFINQVLNALPFGVGEHIRAGLEAIATILTHIPELVASINPLVITPLRQWVSPDENKGLVAEVVNPISANLISPAQGMVEDTAALQTAYDDQLRTPVETALAARSQIRQTLAELTGSA